MLPRPNIVHVEFGEQAADLIHYRLGADGENDWRVLIMAGVHGREHGGIQTAYELLQRLAGVTLRGRVDILPICNPMAYEAETRFTPPSGRDMSRAFTEASPGDLVEALTQAVLALALPAQVVLNLHSAGEARYLPHAIYYRPQDADWATLLGLPFIIMRRDLDELQGHIATRLQPEQRTVTLELGGGVVAYPEDVARGLEVILALLGRMGMLGPGDYELTPTPPERHYTHDARVFVRAPCEGAFYTRLYPGVDLVEGEPFGLLVPLDQPHPRPIQSPITGRLIYLRTRNRVAQGDTLAMFLPHQEAKEEIP
jgi:predicted deacylase